MADFFVRVLKWLAALVVAYFVLFVGLLALLLVVGSFFQPEVALVREDSVLVLDLSMEITDRPRDEDPAQLLFSILEDELLTSVSLREALETIQAARTDTRINSILLKGNLLPGTQYGVISEIRQALAAFAEDKPVYARLEGEGMRDLYLKSVATEVIADPEATADFRGLRAEMLYLGEAFERIGVEVQVQAFEEYKTAAEPFRSSRMSQEDREQLSALIEDIWLALITDMAPSRGLQPDQLDTLAGEHLMLRGNQLLSSGLADRILGHDGFVDYLSERAPYDPDIESFRQIAFTRYLSREGQALSPMDLMGKGNRLAVLYVEGTIHGGESTDDSTGAETLIRDLREMRLDDSVKAVVLRINSPGGGAAASEKIAREIELTNAEKPVIASMGSIATSGGYLVAAPCEAIFAEDLTITGSIGVVSMLPNIAGLADRLSLNFESVETHRFAGAYSLTRPKTEEEMARLREYAADYYEAFLNRVAKNRGLSLEAVREQARGRVWSGAAALRNGLVDQQGGILKAISRAGDLAGIGDAYEIIERPRRLSLEEQIQQLMGAIGRTPPVESALPAGAARELWGEIEAQWRQLMLLNDPHGHYAILPYSLKIR